MPERSPFYRTTPLRLRDLADPELEYLAEYGTEREQKRAETILRERRWKRSGPGKEDA